MMEAERLFLLCITAVSLAVVAFLATDCSERRKNEHAARMECVKKASTTAEVMLCDRVVSGYTR